MIIDLLKINPEFHEFSAEFLPGDISLDEDAARLTGAVKVSGTLSKSDVKYEIKGKIEAPAELDCTRCLQPIATDLNIDCLAAYLSREDYDNSVETELKEGDLEVAISEDNKIDVAELAREQILLILPTRYLCKDDCKGLCLTCGINKNLENCSCEEKDFDPRWEALKNLK
jgi:uncharacterized protein